MIGKLKLWTGIAVTFVIGLLAALVKIKSAEKEAAEAKASQYKDTVTENIKTLKVLQDEQKAKESVNSLSNDGVNSLLEQYSRSRKD